MNDMDTALRRVRVYAQIQVTRRLTYCDDVSWRIGYGVLEPGNIADALFMSISGRPSWRRVGVASINLPAGHVVEFATDDLDDLEMLYNELYGTPGIAVDAVSPPPEPGDQGTVLDFLTVACSGGAITILLQIIKTLIESRDPHFVLKVRCGKDRVETLPRHTQSTAFISSAPAGSTRRPRPRSSLSLPTSLAPSSMWFRPAFRGSLRF